jgi:peptidyl-prolyl cis-trans isomerase A (cyclophilin A)
MILPLSVLLGALAAHPLPAAVMPAGEPSMAPPAPSAGMTKDSLRVRLQTELGDIVVELAPDAAPVTVANFLRYVDGGHYAGGTFYRTVTPDNQPNDSIRIEVIQGGAATDRPGFQPFPPIPMESTDRTGLRHLDGVISMARGAPDSATHAFFICVGDQPELDQGGRRNPDGHGFAAFGRVVEGMEVVRAIQRRPAEGQTLREPVRIVRAERLR